MATHEDLLHIIGAIADDRAAEILALQPTVAEVEEALLWAEGEGDRIDRAGHPAAGKVAQIVEILSVEEPDEEER